MRRRRLRHRSPSDRDRNVHSAHGPRGCYDTAALVRSEDSDTAAPLPTGRERSGSRPFGSLRGDGAGAIPVNADKQKEPDHVDEMPVPRGGFEAEMPLRGELVGAGAEPADDQEQCPNDDMEAVKTGREEEHRGV